MPCIMVENTSKILVNIWATQPSQCRTYNDQMGLAVHANVVSCLLNV